MVRIELALWAAGLAVIAAIETSRREAAHRLVNELLAEQLPAPDPAAVTAMVGELGTGLPAIRGLAEFGALAVPHLVAEATPPNKNVDDALIALRMIVENKQPIGAEATAQIRRLAEERLATGDGLNLTTLWRAIDLAIALKDERLRDIVQSFAADRNALVDRGVAPEFVDQTQMRANERLAGVPAQPRLN
jgi:hypothetical protein